MPQHPKREEIGRMQPHKTDREVLEEFGVVFDSRTDPRVSQFGGLSPILAFLEKGDFRQRLSAQFGDKKARSCLQLALGILAGAKSLDGTERVFKDPLLRKFLGNSVGAIELGRDFRAFTPSEIESLHEFNQSLAILELLQFVPQNEELVFDVDATSVEKFGSQEGVEQGFIEEGKFEDCYQFLFFRLHNLNTFFYGTIRGGAAHSQNGYADYLRRFLPAFKRQWKVCFRTDSGYFSEESIDVYSTNEARFFCKAPMIVTKQSFASVSRDLVWIRDEKNGDFEYASHLTNTKSGTVFREIYKRTRQHKAQLGLFDGVTFRYDCLATNDLVIKDREAFEFYNGRANVENNIRELKNDYALGKIVTESFDANDVITQVTILSYLLLQHFKRTLLPKEMQRMQLSTLRWQVMNIPGTLFREARRQWIRIQNVFANERLYSSIYDSLSRLRSWVISPPEILATI